MIETPSTDSTTLALLLAARRDGDDAKVRALLLLGNGASVDAVSVSSDATPLIMACKHGDLNLARTLLELGASVDAAPESGTTALCTAASAGNAELVALLLSKHASVNAAESTGYTALHIAARHGFADVALLLLEKRAAVDGAASSGVTALMLAVVGGHTSVVSLLLEHHANVNAATSGGNTALHFAIQCGCLDTGALLLDYNAFVDAQDENGTTPLWYAAAIGDLGFVSLLLRKLAAVDLPNANGVTPLTIAVCFGHVGVVSALFEQGARVNVVSMRGSTPVFFAAEKGHADAVSLLISMHADVHATDENGATPLHVAAQSGYGDVIYALIKGSADADAADQNGWTALHNAAQQGHVTAVSVLLSKGASVDVLNAKEGTPLITAAGCGHESVVLALIENAADVNVAAKNQVTPLFLAASNGHARVVKTLLAHGANVNATTSSGETALLAAAHFSHATVVSVLLAHEADVGVVESNGATALYIAAMRGCADIVSALLAKQADVDAPTLHGISPLFVAAQSGFVDVVRLLLENDAAVDTPVAAIDDATPVLIAAANGHTQVVSLLLEKNAFVDTVDSNGATPLCHAANNGHADVVALLLENQAFVDIATLKRTTPLHFAAENGHLDIVRLLLGANAFTEMANSVEATPLFKAAQNGHTDIMRLLLDSNANLNAVAMDNITLLHFAAHFGHRDAVALLIAEQARQATPSPGGSGFVNAVDAHGNTPAVTAAKVGHFHIVNMLLRAGAAAESHAADGETLLVSAARWEDLSLVSLLFELRLLAPPSPSTEQQALHSTLLYATVQSLRGMATKVYETQDMWLHVVERLEDIYALLMKVSEQQQDSVHQFTMIVYQLLKLETTCSYYSVFARIVASASVVRRFHEFHIELTFLEQSLGSGSLNSASTSWEARCKADELVMLERFREIVDGPVPFRLILDQEEAQIQSAHLLQYKMRAYGDTCSPEMLAILTFMLDRVREVATTPVDLVPDWFIPHDELDPNLMRGKKQMATSAAPIRGAWSSSAVIICQHQLPRQKFTEIVKRCFQLSHPNVVKLFGASHLRSPLVAIFENVSRLSLREFLASEDGNSRHGLWQKLYEVALGLKFLHERGLILDNLRCDDIWIGTDGIAKVNVFRCAALQSDELADRTQYVRWQAPEMMREASTPTVASNIYSLGMCILEALTGQMPWGAEESAHAAAKVAVGLRPDPPAGLNGIQTELIQRTMLHDPAKRPTISLVVQQLKEIADEQKAQRRSEPGVQPRHASGQRNLENFIFGELGATLDGFLSKLKHKCQQRRDSKEAVLYVLDRLRDIHGLLQSQHRLPTSAAVVSFCDVLLSFDRFLGNAIGDRSMLQRAKSQKVALQSNVLHRRMDDVLELLVLQTLDPIHLWQHHVDSDSAANVDTAKPGTAAAEGVVRILRFESDKLNQKFKELDFAAIDAAANDELAPRPAWFIPLYELKYERGEAIGVGAFGEVFMATWLGTPVVVKFMGYAADGGEYDRTMFFHELRVWFPLSHPHVVKLFGACHVGKRYFVCEFAGNGTLSQFLKREGNTEKIWRLLHQVALGLQHLHEQNVLHNDLKCDNVLIGSDGSAKLTDFGLSCILDSAEVKIELKRQGAQQWKSPEYLRGDRLTLASDIYGFAMTILEAVTGEPPWGRSTADAVVRIRVKKSVLPPRPALMSSSQWNLVKMMCATDPAQRVKIAFVVEKLHEISQQQPASEHKPSSTVVELNSEAP